MYPLLFWLQPQPRSARFRAAIFVQWKGPQGEKAGEEGCGPTSASHLLCDFGQVTFPFWASVFLFIQ